MLRMELMPPSNWQSDAPGIPAPLMFWRCRRQQMAASPDPWPDNRYTLNSRIQLTAMRSKTGICMHGMTGAVRKVSPVLPSFEV